MAGFRLFPPLLLGSETNDGVAQPQYRYEESQPRRRRFGSRDSVPALTYLLAFGAFVQVALLIAAGHTQDKPAVAGKSREILHVCFFQCFLNLMWSMNMLTGL
jgi:hypothetical protein